MTKIKTIDSTPFKFETEQVNPLFSKAKIYVMYHGDNRNNSNISKETVEKNLHTIKNIPIVGEFIQKDGEGNFGSHGGKIEITDKEIKFIDTTKPIGVIPSEAETYWEEVDGKEYLVVDGAFLWNRYEEEISTLKENEFGQSMELEVFDGQFNEETSIYEINDFAFSALCILGIDKNGSGHVEPCFEDSKIITYSMDKEAFKNEFTQMLKELKFSLSKESVDTKEVNDLDLEKLLSKYNLTTQDLTDKGIDYENLSEEELELKIQEEFVDNDANCDCEEPKEDGSCCNQNKDDKDNQDDEDKKNYVRQFELSHDDIRKKLYTSFEDYVSANELGDFYDYWIATVFDNHFIVQDYWNDTFYKVDYTKSNDDVELNSHVEVFMTYMTKEELDEFESMKTNYELLKSENESLQEFKIEAEKQSHVDSAEEIFEKFSQLSEEDLEELRENVHDFSLEDIETKCYALLGKKLAKFSKSDKQEKSVKVKKVDNDDLPNNDPYGTLFDEFLPKN